MNWEPAEAYVAIPAASFPALAATTPGPRIARNRKIRLLRTRVSRTPPIRIRVSVVRPAQDWAARTPAARAPSSCRARASWAAAARCLRLAARSCAAAPPAPPAASGACGAVVSGASSCRLLNLIASLAGRRAGGAPASRSHGRAGGAQSGGAGGTGVRGLSTGLAESRRQDAARSDVAFGSAAAARHRQWPAQRASLQEPREVQPAVAGHERIEHVVGQDPAKRLPLVVHHQQRRAP